MAQYLASVAAAIAVLVFIVEMLRRGIVAEKFAALWLVVAVVLVVLSVFPSVLGSMARMLGFAVPANLLFALAALLLLAVSVQLSYEVGRLESRSRTLAQRMALLQHEVDVLKEKLGTPPEDNS